MPRAFSDNQKRDLRRRLLEEGREQFARHGYRKARIADIARATAISKGAFYLFFDSKVALFAAIASGVEAETRERLLARMRAAPSVEEQVVRFVRDHLVLPLDPFVDVVLDPEESAAVSRDLTPDARQALRRADDSFCAAVLAEWAGNGLEIEVEAPVLTSLLRALVLLRSGPAAETVAGEAGEILAAGVARELLERRGAR